MKKLLILFSVLAAVAIGSVVWLKAATPAAPASPAPTPAIGTTMAAPTVIAVNTPTTVTVISVITDSTVIATGVNLLRINPTGNPTILGRLRDDGTTGDAVAGDKTFTGQVTFNESTTGEIKLQVSAAFRGMLRRVTSSIITIDVWQTFSDTSSQITFAVPSLPMTVEIENSGFTPDTLFIIKAYVVNLSDNTARAIFSLLAFANSSRDSLPLWFSKNIDPDGSLMAAGTFEQQTLQNGRPAFVRVARLPTTYQGGPVAQAYMLSSSEEYVLAIIGSQTAQLTEFGYSVAEVPGILNSILGSVK
jgi:hypothetical protein